MTITRIIEVLEREAHGEGVPDRLEELVGRVLAVVRRYEADVGVGDDELEDLDRTRLELIGLTFPDRVYVRWNVQSTAVALARVVLADANGEEDDAGRWTRLALEPWNLVE